MIYDLVGLLLIIAATWLLVLILALYCTVVRRIWRYIRSRGGFLRVWAMPPRPLREELRAFRESFADALCIATFRRPHDTQPNTQVTDSGAKPTSKA